MGYLAFIIFFFIFTTTSCRPKAKPLNENADFQETIIYPGRAYVCFDPDGKGKRERIFKLGDSLLAVRKVFQSTPDTLVSDTILKSKNFIVKQRDFGICTISWIATFDNTQRLKNFKASWTYKGDTTKRGRSDFYNAILRNSMSCLGEEGP